MKNRIGVSLLLVFFVCFPVVSQELVKVQPETVGMSAERLGRLSGNLQQYVDDNRIAGAVAIVVRRGNIAYLEAFGSRDIESGDAMRPDTIFRIASQTKALVSVGVMILQEEGKLLITDPVGNYLPAFLDTSVAQSNGSGGYDIVKASRPITIRDLLTHTAGISYGTGPAAEVWEEAGVTGWYFADRNETVGDVMNRLAELPLDADPGTEWIYGYNTDILGAMIEEITGQTLAEFFQDRIFDPLGLTDTHFFAPQNKSSRVATVYSSIGDQIERAPAPGGFVGISHVGQGAYLNGPRKSFSGGAGLLSTAEDYATFLQMLLNGGELNGTRILSRTSVNSMTVNHTGPLGISFRPGQGFGLGFSIVENPAALGLPASVGEFGWGGAYHSTYWVDPKEELVVVYLTQLIPATNIDDHAKLRTLIHQAIID